MHLHAGSDVGLDVQQQPLGVWPVVPDDGVVAATVQAKRTAKVIPNR